MNAPQKDRSTLFIMKPTKGAEFALTKWLEQWEFDEMTSGWNDKKGNPGIGLLTSKKGGKPERVAVIICYDGSEVKAQSIVEQHLGYGDQNE
jgi:hypothetical protein